VKEDKEGREEEGGGWGGGKREFTENDLSATYSSSDTHIHNNTNQVIMKNRNIYRDSL
jgi:hypothetical protein